MSKSSLRIFVLILSCFVGPTVTCHGATKDLSLAKQVASLVKKRNDLMAKSHLGGRAFIPAKEGMRSARTLSNQAGMARFNKSLTQEQDKLLLLVQLDAIGLAARLEQFMRSSGSSAAKQSNRDQAWKIVRDAVQEKPHYLMRASTYTAGGMTIAESKRIKKIASPFQNQPNPFHDDPAVMSRSALVLIEHGSKEGIKLLDQVLESSSNHPDVQYLLAVASQIILRKGTVNPDSLTDRQRTELRNTIRINNATRRAQAFWSSVENSLVELWHQKLKAEQKFKAEGGCTQCWGSGRESEMFCAVCNGNGRFGTALCPGCGGLGKGTASRLTATKCRGCNGSGRINR